LGRAITIELARLTADAMGSLTPVSTPPSDPQNRTPLDTGFLLVSFLAFVVASHRRIDGRRHHRAMEHLTPLFPFMAESEA
jgi:hypothetical protein